MPLNRRELLTSGLTLGLTSFGLAGLTRRADLRGSHLDRHLGNELGYGPIKKKPAKNTGEMLLSLPDGFEYTAFGKTDSVMADGRKTPALHDGMAAFAYERKVRLVRNHEIRAKASAAIGGKEKSYDPSAGGGTTTLVVDPKTRELVKDWASLSGTIVNCAGGSTPWGTWLSCEETTVGVNGGEVYHKDREVTEKFEREHGYIFEVAVSSDGLVEPTPIKEMGRFVHEATAVDPITGIVYLTEDTGTSGFYRFIPNVPAQLHKGGKLQQLRVKSKPGWDTRRGVAGEAMRSFDCDWVDISDPDPSTAEKRPLAVFEQGKAQGAATFGRLEGCWYGDGFVYINSTDGGDAKCGQVWRYRPIGDGGELTLIFESPGKEVLEAPDNICVSPRGGLVICEDGDGQNFLRGLLPDGRIFTFAGNDLNDSELAGACFSPDGETLFVNIQTPGITLAIWGPWGRGQL